MLRNPNASAMIKIKPILSNSSFRVCASLTIVLICQCMLLSVCIAEDFVFEIIKLRRAIESAEDSQLSEDLRIKLIEGLVLEGMYVYARSRDC